MLPIHLTDVTTVTAIVRCTEGKRVNIYIYIFLSEKEPFYIYQPR